MDMDSNMDMDNNMDMDSDMDIDNHNHNESSILMSLI
jgi:hypothetical protein